ncbi:MAG: hypothetical protein JW920_02300 [Deltaproteobacteria bacterium]|nr:hypothetical protein [Deltaproteobacteria bacterium]
MKNKIFLPAFTVFAIISIGLLISDVTPHDTAEHVVPDTISKTLKIVLDDESSSFGQTLSGGQLNNITFAFDRIRPDTFEDVLFITACSISHLPQHDIIEEYACRETNQKDCAAPLMHAMQKRNLPVTRGILIFEEQINAVLAELTGRAENECGAILTGILTRRIGADELRDLIELPYRSQLEAGYLQQICEDIIYARNQGGGRSYAWCFSVAKRAIDRAVDKTS